MSLPAAASTDLLAIASEHEQKEPASEPSLLLDFDQSIREILDGNREKTQEFLDLMTNKKLTAEQIRGLSSACVSVLTTPNQHQSKRVNACLLLGVISEHNSTPEINTRDVYLSFYTIAARYGSIDAMLFLAEICQNQDPGQSAYWYRCALKYAPKDYHRDIKLSLVKLLRVLFLKLSPLNKESNAVHAIIARNNVLYHTAIAFEENEALLLPLLVNDETETIAFNTAFYQTRFKEDDLLEDKERAFYAEKFRLLPQVRCDAQFNLDPVSGKKVKVKAEDISTSYPPLDRPIKSTTGAELSLLGLLANAFKLRWKNLATFLLEEMNVNPYSIPGNAPDLCIAASYTGHVKVVKALIAAKKITDLEKEYPFAQIGGFHTEKPFVFIAAAYLNLPMLRFLIDEMQVNYRFMTNNRYASHLTPGEYNLLDFYMMALASQRIWWARLQMAIEGINYLSSKGLVLSAGWTPLHWAARFNNLALARALVERGMGDILAPSENGITPFHLTTDPDLVAFFNSQLSIIQPAASQLLLKNKLYKVTLLSEKEGDEGKSKTFLLESDTGEKFVARELELHSQKDITEDGKKLPSLELSFHPTQDRIKGVAEASYYHKIHGFGERIFLPTHQSSCFVLRRHFPGRPLAKPIAQDQLVINFSTVEFLKMFLATAIAFNDLHVNHNLVHSDPIPTNFIFDNGVVKLIDFEAACEMHSEAWDKDTHEIFIKGAYFGRFATFSDDIYGLGIIFSKMYLALLAANENLTPPEKAALVKLNNRNFQALLLAMTDKKELPTLTAVINTLQNILASKENTDVSFKPPAEFLEQLQARLPESFTKFVVSSDTVTHSQESTATPGSSSDKEEKAFRPLVPCSDSSLPEGRQARQAKREEKSKIDITTLSRYLFYKNSFCEKLVRLKLNDAGFQEDKDYQIVQKPGGYYALKMLDVKKPTSVAATQEPETRKLRA